MRSDRPYDEQVTPEEMTASWVLSGGTTGCPCMPCRDRRAFLALEHDLVPVPWVLQNAVRQLQRSLAIARNEGRSPRTPAPEKPSTTEPTTKEDR